MTPQHDFTPWQPQRYAGLVSTWEPITSNEARAVLTADVLIMKALISSALAHQERKGGARG